MADNSAENAFLQSLQADTPGTEEGTATADAVPVAVVPKQTNTPQTIGGFVLDDEDDEDEDDDENNNNEEGADEDDSYEPSSNEVPNIDRGLSEKPQHSVDDSSNPNALAPHVTLQAPSQQDETVPNTGANGIESMNDAADVSVPDAVSQKASAQVQDGDEAKPAPVSPPRAPSIDSSEKDLTPVTKSRLPQDRVGMLEDRVADDPLGDTEAWLSLIAEHRKRGKFDDVRKTYDRFLTIFPTCAEQWVAYCSFELELNELQRLEAIFQRSLTKVLSIDLWYIYLNYIRRRYNLATDQTDQSYNVINATYKFMLKHVGGDPESGKLWHDFIEFVGQRPGQVGGSDWKDQQKMDELRSAYQQAVCVPTNMVQVLWKEYGNFETGLNKTTGNKYLQEKSPNYMSARIAYGELQQKIDGLKRTTLPSLPPAPGFEGDADYQRQVELWKTWIEWEQGDPLSLKAEDPVAYKDRIVYSYKQALMALRFWPEMWFEAAEFCYQNDLSEQGDTFLQEGTEANPESCLLAFQRGDRLEMKTLAGGDPNSLKKKGDVVREPYDKLLNALYQLYDRVKARETKTLNRIREHFAAQQSSAAKSWEDDADEPGTSNTNASDAAQQAQIDAVQKGNAAQLQVITKTISFGWIALMRSMRRIQGKGGQGEVVGGLRQIFAEGRKRGRVTSDFWISSALLEHTCYGDAVGRRIFERALKLFPTDERLALAYLEHLMSINETASARAVFETTVNKMESSPETLPKAKPLYAFFHRFESAYGELTQINKLEQRMASLFPEDPRLLLFSRRYMMSSFDPTAVRPIISPATQTKPKGLASSLAAVLPSIEHPGSITNSPKPQVPPLLQNVNSPKRPFDDSDSESLQPRKVARGESPLKGAAGRRLDAQRRREAAQKTVPTPSLPMPPVAMPVAPLPPHINFILSILPPAATYSIQTFNPDAVVELLRNLDTTRVEMNRLAALGRPTSQAPPQQNMQTAYGVPSGSYSYGG